MARERQTSHCRLKDPAAATEKPSQLVCCVTGDGPFIFGAPSAVYWAQHKLSIPFLSIVVNNGGWKATRSCINDVHPRGLAAGVTDVGLGIDLKLDGPDYVGIAVAASNNTLHAENVSKVEGLKPALERALRVVQVEKRGALLEVVILWLLSHPGIPGPIGGIAEHWSQVHIHFSED